MSIGNTVKKRNIIHVTNNMTCSKLQNSLSFRNSLPKGKDGLERERKKKKLSLTRSILSEVYLSEISSTRKDRLHI